MADAKIVLYTNHRCPWAHRVHIALSELQLPFKEEIIDLDTPRTPAYLDINPRGLVPSLSYNGQILTESAIVANFLADAYPSHLLPPSETTEGALKRARVAFFVDTFTGKWQSAYNKAIYSKSDKEGSLAAKEAVKVLVRELEPLLKDAKPFFGGSEKLTQVEVLTGSFIVRLFAHANAGLLPANLIEDVKQQAPHFYRWAEAVNAHPSVTGIFDAEVAVDGAKKRIAKARATGVAGA